jgi:uncharacterized coiled-coil DUF342 family protein
MSKFGLNENDVNAMISPIKTSVEENTKKIADMNNKSGWDRALGSSLRTLDTKLQTLQAEIAVIQERLENIARIEAGINKG